MKKNISRVQLRSYRIPSFFLLLVVLVQTACSDSQGFAKEDKPTGKAIDSEYVKAIASKTEFIEMNGRKLAYRSVGSGLPIILCQRFRGNLDSWDPAFLDALAQHYRVITFDYTGFGRSTGTPPENMIGFAQDVKDLSAALKLNRFIIGGWSFGGAVAQIVTTEMRDLVTHTILIGTRPPGAVKHKAEQIFYETSRKPINDLADEVILFFEPASELSKELAKASHDRIAARTEDQDVYIKQELWPKYVSGFADFEKDPYHAREKISQTDVPILVISADHEVVFPPENWFELNRKTRSIQLIVIPQSGHGVHHQYPDMVVGYIRSFLEKQG